MVGTYRTNPDTGLEQIFRSFYNLHRNLSNFREPTHNRRVLGTQCTHDGPENFRNSVLITPLALIITENGNYLKNGPAESEIDGEKEQSTEESAEKRWCHGTYWGRRDGPD